jgi:hypothetical protein
MDNTVGLRDKPEPPEPPIVAHCAYCEGGGEIYGGEYFGYDGKSCICEECIDKVWNYMSVSEKMNLFGYSYVTRM